VLPWIYVLFVLFLGIRFFERTVVCAFRQIEAREVATREWVQKQTAKPPGSEREAKRHKLANEVGDLEAETARQLRRLMFLAAIPFALLTVITPLLVMWFFMRIHCLLRGGAIARAEVVSRKRWTSSARLSFLAADGRHVEVVHTIPPYVPIGVKLWVLYSPRRPRRSLVYRPDAEIAKLLCK
jgi:hypothetical protein